MKRLNHIILAGGLVIGLAANAHAGTDTDNLTVTANVSDTCTITGGTLAFGTYDTVSGAALNGTATISVACTTDATATITLGQGANADTSSTADVPLRRMSDGSTNHLGYKFYSDSGRTTVWGDTSGTGKGYTATSSSSSDQTVYGTIDASQDVPAGSYSDTVIATVTF